MRKGNGAPKVRFLSLSLHSCLRVFAARSPTRGVKWRKGQNREEERQYFLQNNMGKLENVRKMRGK